MTGASFEFTGLCGGYGDTVVLRNISARVKGGNVLGVLGRNGVGKSTLLRLLMGYLVPSSGDIEFRSRDIKMLTVHERFRAGIAYMPQEGVVFDTLTVRENLTLHRNAGDISVYQPLFEEFPRLFDRLDQTAGSFSGGEKKILSFARTIADKAVLTLLDEPSEGVQQENIDRMSRIIRARAAEGAIFVVVEQNLGFLMDVMDQVLVLDHGVSVLEKSSPLIRSELEQHLRL